MVSPRAILIDVIPPTMDKAAAARRILELESLTHTFGGMVIVKIIQKRATPDYKTYIGSGKLQEVVDIASREKVELLIINNLLKPHQIFNLERAVEKMRIKVWDRIDLILKIFQKHATTTEAKLQIRLAGIRHMGPRIYRMGLELGQQAGGIGTRGSGETNIEVMRRHLEEEERTIKKQLEKYANTREQHRKHRTRLGLKTVSIVGYTNAGKSSLLNALTRKGAYVADALFATLDTRVAKLYLPSPSSDAASPLTSSSGVAIAETRGSNPINVVRGTGYAAREVLLSDTIGFIQDLPPQLIQAFRSTLEETVQADLVLHVIDVSDPFLPEKIVEVEQVLSELDVSSPKIYVFNKTDLVKRIPRSKLTKAYKQFHPVFVSAHSGSGLDDLKLMIAELV